MTLFNIFKKKKVENENNSQPNPQSPLEDKLKEQEIRQKKAEVESFEPQRIKDNLDKTLIEKINTLRSILTADVVDDENQIPGMDPVYKPVLNENEVLATKKKLFELINQL